VNEQNPASDPDALPSEVGAIALLVRGALTPAE